MRSGKKAADQEWKDVRTELANLKPTTPLCWSVKIDTASVTESQLTFVRTPRHAADRVNFDKVVVYQGETTRSRTRLSGDVDYATHGFTLAVDKAMKDAGIRVARPPLYTGPALYFHWEKAPEFQDVRLRYAVAHAINKQESAAITYGDSGKAQKYMAGFSDNIIADWIGSGDLSKLKEYEFSLAKADQFMKDAGYAKGSDGIYAKGGKKLELELVFPSDFADWSSAATHAAESLTKFGIKVTPRGLVNSTQQPEVNDGNARVLRPRWARTRDRTRSTPSSRTCGPITRHRWRRLKYPLKQKLPSTGKDIDFDEMINRTGDGTDEAKQKTAVTELALAFNELLPIIPLWQRFGNNPINDVKRVAGWPADGDGIYKNPDGDSFAMTLLIRGTIGGK